MMEQRQDIVIIGAGLAGVATSLGLYRLGIKSLVLEASPSLRITGFALTTWTNAWKVFDALGVGDSLRQQHVLIDGLIAASLQTGEGGHASLKIQGKHGEHEVRCQKRKILLETLAFEIPKDTIKFSSKVVSIQEESGYFKLVHLADGTVIKAKALIGCDGVNSVVGKWLGFKKPILTGRSAIRGMAYFKDGHGFGPKFQHVFGNGLRSGFLPCDDFTVYWFFTWTPPSPDELTLDNSAKMKQIVLSKLDETVNPYLKNVVENTEVENIDSAPLGYRYPLELLWKDISKGNVCVAGDALHPMTPDLGQGGCCSLEDGLVLARCLAEALLSKENGTTFETDDGDKERQEYERIENGLQKYARERRWRSFDIVTTSYLVGFIMESKNVVLKFLRERILGKFIGYLMLKKSDYDCGKLISS